MKTITMYELLGLVKDGKAPKKIKYENSIYVLNDNKAWADEVYSLAGNSNVRLNFEHIKSLNDEVEILEEEKKIPEKIPLSSYHNSTDDIKEKVLINKINEIIDCLDYLKSKGDE